MIPAKYWSPTKKLMLLGAMAGGKAVEDTVTGNPLTFLTDFSKPLKSLLIPFTPKQTGSGDPSPLNIRPIVPWDGLTVWHGGKNLLNPASENSYAYGSANNYTLSGGSVVTSGSTLMGFKVKCRPSTKYTFSFNTTNSINARVYGYTEEPSSYTIGNSLVNVDNVSEITFTTGATDEWLICGIYVRSEKPPTTISEFQLEVGDTATAYEPYKPITETDISFPSPVYGGTLDAVTGVLTVDTVCETFTWGDVSGSSLASVTRKGFQLSHDTLNTLTKDGKYCDKAKFLNDYSSNTTHFYTAVVSGKSNAYIFLPNGTPDTETVQIAYPLDTPQEIQLTPQQITALVGNNTLWSDANGDMTAVFFKKG